ncbi:MAG TPA: Na+/H+ antiporter [Steroidobacteraceae bacterium]|nr:Na+/H+ antiporter [Steroidobacteraceae bacterium]
MPLIHTIQILVLLLAVTAAVGVCAARLKVPPSILLVITGVVLAVIPGLPALQLSPEVVLLLVLPLVVYWSAVAMSWREFRFNLFPISMLAVGCVMFTTAAAAAAAHWLLGLPWPEGFVLGAIISPPDALAPLSIARRLKLPRRILVILEGEGLANYATALILYRFAVVAVSLGAFSLGRAAGTFCVIVAGEVLWGIGVGWMMLRLRRWAADPPIEITLSVLTPFLAFWPPEYLGGSGVLATVAVGLYVSFNGPRLISPATRLQGVFFWDFLTYTLEGLVFLITGLQARALIAGIRIYSLRELAISAVVVSAVVIAARFAWMFPATYVPRWLSPSLRHRDPPPPWQSPFALAFTGVRGIVSLAAALALPLATPDGAPFPHRDLILFLTFCVIMVTLVGQGLTMPAVMRGLGLPRAGYRERRADREAEFAARRQAVEAALARLEQLISDRELTEEVVAPLRGSYHDQLIHLERRSDAERRRTELHEEIELQLLAAERERINELSRGGQLKDEARRRIERELDLRDAQLQNLRAGE